MRVNKREFADILGVSPREVTRLIAAGLPCQSAKKKGVAVAIDSGEALDWMLRREREAGAAEDPASQSNERTRLAAAQAEKVELENARRRGELVLASDIAETEYVMSTMFVKHLDALPGRCANELAGIADPARVRSRLLDEVRDIRTAVARALDERADALASLPDDGDDLDAAAEENAGGVGGRVPDVAAGERRAGAIS